MKKILALLLVVLVAVPFFAFTASAAAERTEIVFRVLEDSETPYVHEENGSRDAGSRFNDASNVTTYKFPVKAGHHYAELTINLGAQILVEGSSDGTTYTEIYRTEIPSGAADSWGEDRSNRTYDLSSYLTGADGFIYVRIGDANSANGWGAYIEKGHDNKFIADVAAPATEPPVELPAVELGFAPDPGSNNGITFDTPVDISAYMANGYVHVYATFGEGAVSPASFELSSAGGGDNGEISIPIGDEQANGVRVLSFKLSALSDGNGPTADKDFDPTKVNYTRIYTGAGSGAEVTITRIVVTNSSTAPAEATPPATEAPATNPPAPATSDSASLMIAIAAVAALSIGVVATKKRK